MTFITNMSSVILNPIVYALKLAKLFCQEPILN